MHTWFNKFIKAMNAVTKTSMAYYEISTFLYSFIMINNTALAQAPQTEKLHGNSMGLNLQMFSPANYSMFMAYLISITKGDYHMRTTKLHAHS